MNDFNLIPKASIDPIKIIFRIIEFMRCIVKLNVFKK